MANITLPTRNYVTEAVVVEALDDLKVNYTHGVRKVTQTATTDTATITASQILSGCLDATPTAAATYTMPTAALLVAAMTDASVGDTFEFMINNKSGGANTVTVAAGTGGTADGTLTTAQNVIRTFKVIVTNVTAASEAYFIYGIA